MSSYDSIRAHRRQISEQTSRQFPQLSVLINEAMSLLIDASAIQESASTSLDFRTTEGASQTAAWRFLSTLPISASWCFEIAASGDYNIAKNILRLTLEETIKLAYYVIFPDKALRQILHDRDQDQVKIVDMIKELELDHRAGLLKLHGGLSALYAHANLNLPPELLIAEGERTLIGGGPRFMPTEFEAITHQLLILMANALKYLLIPFPSMIQDRDWMTRFERFLQAADTVVSRKNTAAP